MAVYYVRPDGLDSHTGLASDASHAFLTLGKAASVVAAGDTVNVAAGTYRELLTISTSGTIGNVISWIGDYLGTVFTDVGSGVVRLTGAAANDQSVSRANCITATTKNYNNFTGFLFDTASNNIINLLTGCTNWVFDKSCFQNAANQIPYLNITGAAQNAITVQNCVFYPSRATAGVAGQIYYLHSATVSNAGHVVQNCIFLGASSGFAIESDRVGGITCLNNVFSGGGGINVGIALAVGQTITVNNNIFSGCSTALGATATGEIVEDYNTFFANGTNRSNTNTGAHSVAYPPLYDARWFFQLVFAGAGANNASQVISPFDLASYSALVNLAGTSPTTTDIRGTAVQGAQREWGALEYDSTLKLKAGGGGVSRARVVAGG